VLRTPSKDHRSYVEIPKANVLEHTTPTTLFENAGVQDEIFIEDLTNVLDGLLDRRTQDPTFPLSFLLRRINKSLSFHLFRYGSSHHHCEI
jgi:hypothetical protein